ncbi:MAG: hypothetical protein OHK0046_22570 [Anaerolineae bacterium]
MTINRVLMGRQRIYIETAPLIYFVEENPQYVEKMEAVLKYIEQQEINAFSSVIILPEVLKRPLQEQRHDLAREYRKILIDSQQFQLLPVTLSIAEQSAALRARYNLRTPDALHVATALNAGCDAFLTNDGGIRRVTELQILMLDDLELE